MIINKTFQYRIYPNEKQIKKFVQWDRALRFLWNLCHEQRLLGLSKCKDDKKYINYFDQSEELTVLKNDYKFLQEVPAVVEQQMLKDLDIAWQRSFDKISYQPHWKKRGKNFFSFKDVNHTKGFYIQDNYLKFPKVDLIRIIQDRPLEGKSKSCAISKDGDQWYASIMCEVEISDLQPVNHQVVAIDRNIVNILVDSNGNFVDNPKFYKKSLTKLKRAQRALSRKKKGSKNRDKAKLKISKIHRKIRNQREHFIHNLSNQYVKNHGVVVIEDLKVSNMVKNKNLSQSIMDAGWGMLKEQLEYKTKWNGNQLIKVPAQYSSQECSQCSCIDAKNRTSQENFTCLQCGHHENADLNAAKVLKKRYEKEPEKFIPKEKNKKRKSFKEKFANRKKKHAVCKEQTPGNTWCAPARNGKSISRINEGCSSLTLDGSIFGHCEDPLGSELCRYTQEKQEIATEVAEDLRK